MGQTAQSLTCSIMEKPHTRLDDCLNMLKSCFRKRISVLQAMAAMSEESRPPERRRPYGTSDMMCLLTWDRRNPQVRACLSFHRSSSELIASTHFVDCCEKSAETYNNVSADLSQQSTKWSEAISSGHRRISCTTTTKSPNLRISSVIAPHRVRQLCPQVRRRSIRHEADFLGPPLLVEGPRHALMVGN